MIDMKLSVSKSRGLIVVCFSCDELINSIGMSGRTRVLARPEPEGPKRQGPPHWKLSRLALLRHMQGHRASLSDNQTIGTFRCPIFQVH